MELKHCRTKPLRTDEAFARLREHRTPDAERDLHRALTTQAEAVCIKTLGRLSSDVVSKAVSKGMMSAPAFRGESQYSTFFYRVVLRDCISAGQSERKDRLRNCSMDELPSSQTEELARVEPDLDSRILVNQLVSSLPPKDRRIFNLFLAGYTRSEIAEELQIPVKTLNTRFTRLCKTLRKRCNGHSK